MKKVLSIIALAGLFICSGIAAKAQYTPSWAAPSGDYSLGSYPVWYTDLDTMGSSGMDTNIISLHKGYITSSSNTLNTITFTHSVLWATGGTTVNPTVTGALYESADNGATYGTTPVTTFTVTPTSLTVPKVVNYTVTGNPATDYMWTYGNSASNTASVASKVLIR